MSHINLKNLNLNTSFQKISQKPEINRQSSNLLASIHCESCKKLKIEVVLTCGHKVCLECFRTKVENYTLAPSIKTFKKASCLICRQNYSEIDICQYLKENSQISEFLNIKILKKCDRCGLEKNLQKEYFAEMRCLHLCSNCYADDLIFDQNICFVCQKKYQYSESTNNRKADCGVCKANGFFVGNCFRKIDEDHVGCFDCLNEVFKNKKCLVCYVDLEKKKALHIKDMINKKCGFCRKNISLSSVFFHKTCCDNITCNECFNINKKCPFCD